MARRLLAYLLIVVLIASNFSRLFIYAGFELNRNYIATKLCENRDKPWLHCNGKCYFMKKIKQAEDKEKSEERQSQKNLFQEAFWPATTEMKFRSVLLQVMPIPNDDIILTKTNTLVFRPPQFS
ncbi:MAG: hypothetical protein JWR02_2248 [Mucilaginibacter sp.]|nr:hypothetical protein [Mucilaginibacter sp.]